MLRLICSFTIYIAFSPGLPALQAAQVSPGRLSALHWRLIGPFRAGRVIAAEGIADRPNTYYVGAVGGGLWKTEDGGVVYKPIFDQTGIASIGALAVARSNPDVIYAGTGEADMRSDITFGNGVYRSDDAGKTWKHVGLEDTQQIGRIWVDPRNPNRVLAAALGHAFGPNDQRGVFLSEDGGGSWQKTLWKNSQTGAIDLAVQPDNTNIVYACLWESHRVPWSVYAPVSGPGSGLYKSYDGGRTWSQLAGHGLPAGNWGRSGVAIAPNSDGKRVYAIIDAPEGGLFRSDDGGETWQRKSSDPRIRQRLWYFGGISIDPRNPDVVYLSNVSIFRSVDGGTTFTAFKGAPGGDDYHSLWIDPSNPARMVAGSDQGATISVDEGRSWSSWYNQPTGQFYHVSADSHFPYRIYGPQQDSGSIAIDSNGANGEVTWRDWRGAGGGESGYMLPDPHDSNIVYSSETNGGVSKFDWRTGQVADISPHLHAGLTTDLSKLSYRYPWTPALAISPVTPFTIYSAAQFLLKSETGGRSWLKISGDLTGMAKDGPDESGQVTPANAGERGFGVINSIAPSPLHRGLVWVGSDTGLIHLTTNDGVTWKDVTPAGLLPWSTIGIIEASHFDTQTAYLSVERQTSDDYKPYIYRTHDGGRSWKLITNGLPGGVFVNVVREDTKRKGLLYAGTELGVHVSFDDGENWQPLQLNLPPVSVRDIALHESDLIIGTHGRAFWVLDDIGPLRQLRSDNPATTVLYRPATAIRVRRVEFEGTPFPPEIPKAENAPDGVPIYYELADARTTPVKLEILNSKGDVIRHFESGPLPPLPQNKEDFPDFWLRAPQQLTANTGLNCFVWDLRYSGPPGGHGPFAAHGPMATPGLYKVRLTVDGKTLTQRLQIKLDPRVSVPLAALREQLAFGLRVRDSIEAAQDVLAKIKELNGKLNGPVKGVSAADLDALKHALDELAPAAESPADGTLPETASELSAIGTAAESADQAPTVTVQHLYSQAATDLAHCLAEWKNIQQNRLRQINAQLRAMGALPIVLQARAENEADTEYHPVAGKMEMDAQ